MAEYLLTVQEAAKLLNIGERAVRKNVLSGKYGTPRYAETPSRCRGGRELRIPLAALPIEAQEAYAQKNAPAPDIRAEKFATAPEWQREIAGMRHGILNRYGAYLAGHAGNRCGAAAAFAKEYSDAHPGEYLSASTLRRWEMAYKAGGLAALLPGYGKRKGRRDISPEAWQSFCGKYLQLSRLSVQYCYKLVSLEAREYGWRLPSLGTVARMAKEDIPEAVKRLKRYGQKDYYDNIAAFTRRDPESISAGEVFVGDHHVFDFMVRYEGRWVRPWLTVWIDMRSRKMVGWHIGVNPSTDTIIAAFAEAALNPAIGLPRHIYIDNGQDYCSYKFAGRGHRGKRLTDEDKIALIDEGERTATLMERLGVKAHYAIVENARAKVVEREFRNVVEWCSKIMPTYCGRNKNERPEDLARKLKQETKYGITLEELRKLFADWALHVYNKTVSQKGKGREGESPDATFARTRLPVRTASFEVLQLYFMKSTNPFRIGRNGVSFRGREYCSPDFILRKGQSVYIRYREDDLSRVWLYDTKDGYVGEAKLVKAIAAIGADKETLAEEMRRKAAEKKAVKEHPAYKAASAAPPISLTEIIELYKKHNDSAPDVAPTDVVEIANLPEAGRDAVRRMKATGTETVNPFEAMSKAKIEKRKGDK